MEDKALLQNCVVGNYIILTFQPPWCHDMCPAIGLTFNSAFCRFVCQRCGTMFLGHSIALDFEGMFAIREICQA